MPSFTVEVPDHVMRRLEALAGASGRSVDDLAREALDAFAGSFASRRAIVKARGAAGATYSLAELGWLDGYRGQTVDELLVFEPTSGAHSVLAALEEAIQAKVKEQGPGKTTGMEWMVQSLMALWREVNNGGYHQFFFNSSRRFAPRVVQDLVRAGCPELADITQDALDALGLEQLSVPAIEAAIATEDVSRDRKLERCDTAFYGRAELPERLLAYVRSHPGGIKI